MTESPASIRLRLRVSLILNSLPTPPAPTQMEKKVFIVKLSSIKRYSSHLENEVIVFPLVSRNLVSEGEKQ